MRIQINEGHLSAQARREDAERFIQLLEVEGWPVEYASGQAVWDFPSVYDLYDFEKDFDKISEELFPPYVWRVKFPCDCGEELHSDFCECGMVDDPVMNVTFRDYERALEQEREAMEKDE